MYLNKRHKWDYCALCGEQLAHVSVIVVLTTRGQRPRFQANSGSWNICRGCLRDMPKRMSECRQLKETIESFDAQAPRPRHRRSLAELLATYPGTADEKGAGGC